MLSAGDVLKMLVGLKQAGDLDIISSDAVLSSTCKPDDRSKVLAMAAIVDQLLDAFEYERSPEFEAMVKGKSDDVRELHRKLLSPEKLRNHSVRFGQSLTELLVSDEAFELMPLGSHDSLNELKSLASSISG